MHMQQYHRPRSCRQELLIALAGQLQESLQECLLTQSGTAPDAKNHVRNLGCSRRVQGGRVAPNALGGFQVGEEGTRVRRVGRAGQGLLQRDREALLGRVNCHNGRAHALPLCKVPRRVAHKLVRQLRQACAWVPALSFSPFYSRQKPNVSLNWKCASLPNNLLTSPAHLIVSGSCMCIMYESQLKDCDQPSL